MLKDQKQQLAALFEQAARELAASVDGPIALPEIVLERPRQPEHGDLACNLALQLARPMKRAPRQVAEALVEVVRRLDAAGSGLIERIDIAGPGFINLRLAAQAHRQVIVRVLGDGGHYGCNARGADERVLLEFVSANPTGPLHVGHGRQAALGDTLAALFEANGWAVTREFYYNDAGAQINNLALSVQARARAIEPDDPRFPADGYRGQYIVEIAEAYRARATVSSERVPAITAIGDPDDLDAIRRFAVACLRREQDADLRAFGVAFDNYYLESSLYTDGRVDQAVAELIAAGVTYEEGGALWFASSRFGDDKDRVMRKSDGSYTYFVPDVAYHVTKWQRGFARAINIQGSDHHGTTARVRAGLQALGLGIPVGYPQYVLHKMVTVMRAGEEVKISKRAGSYVTLRDLIEWSGERRDPQSGEPLATDERRGRDAVRFFLVSRKADTEFVFDIDLALAASDENPVYYIQYAHARICSVIEQAARAAGTDLACFVARIEQDVVGAPLGLAPLTAPREYELMARLAAFPELIEQAADELAPHSIAFYLRELAADLHGYYNSERVLVDDPALRQARLALLLAVRQVLQNGLALLGVSAPERM
jgi:arginyl-tRNA synthetase